MYGMTKGPKISSWLISTLWMKDQMRVWSRHTVGFVYMMTMVNVSGLSRGEWIVTMFQWTVGCKYWNLKQQLLIEYLCVEIEGGRAEQIAVFRKLFFFEAGYGLLDGWSFRNHLDVSKHLRIQLLYTVEFRLCSIFASPARLGALYSHRLNNSCPKCSVVWLQNPTERSLLSWLGKVQNFTTPWQPKAKMQCLTCTHSQSSSGYVLAFENALNWQSRII